MVSVLDISAVVMISNGDVKNLTISHDSSLVSKLLIRISCIALIISNVFYILWYAMFCFILPVTNKLFTLTRIGNTITRMDIYIYTPKNLLSWECELHAKFIQLKTYSLSLSLSLALSLSLLIHL
jgi:hypothetical protein